MWMEKNIYFTEHDIYFTKLMFILKNINLELKSALRTKYIFYRILLYIFGKVNIYFTNLCSTSTIYPEQILLHCLECSDK